MNTDWMGRYRPLVAELVRHSNITQRVAGNRTSVTDEISLNAQEWQVFEYILEHLDDDAHMNQISERLGIPQSSFSKITKTLCGHGLIDKYQMAGNRKNVILRPSEKGFAVYQGHSAQIMASTFRPFFEMLEGFSDEEVGRITEALALLNCRLLGGPKQERQLIRK